MSVAMRIGSAEERTMIELLVANGAIKVTRCPPGAKQWDSNINYRNSGVLPGHLDPRFLPETPEEREARERDQLAAPNVVTSRRKRVRRG